MRTLRFLALLLVLTLPVPTSASGAPSVTTLVHYLEDGGSLRLRVKAALALGKTHDPRARRPLEDALDDDSPAVRAAAAAALRVLGDPRAIAALKRHQNERIPAVRSQVRGSITALRRRRFAENPRVLVQLGELSVAERRARPMEPGFLRASRRRLESLPGVLVLEDFDDPDEAARECHAPVVMVSGSLQEVGTERRGSTVVYSAKVEYAVHTMPGRNIVGLVSGHASTRASVAESRDRKRAHAIRLEVLEAAVASAVRRAPPALEAAME